MIFDVEKHTPTNTTSKQCSLKKRDKVVSESCSDVNKKHINNQVKEHQTK